MTAGVAELIEAVASVQGEGCGCLAMLQSQRFQRFSVVNRFLIGREDEGIELVVKPDAVNLP